MMIYKLETDRYIGPPILSTDIWPFEYRSIYRFNLYNDKRCSRIGIGLKQRWQSHHIIIEIASHRTFLSQKNRIYVSHRYLQKIASVIASQNWTKII